MRSGPLLALIAYCIVFAFSAVAGTSALYIIGALSILHALLDPRSLLLWLRFTARISIFLIALLIAGYLLNQSFPYQILLVLRFAIFLLISAMIVRSITLDGLYRAVSGIQTKRFADFCFYLFCTLMFIPILFREYDDLRQQNRGNGLKSLTHRVENVFHNAMNRGDEVAQQAKSTMEQTGVDKRGSYMSLTVLFFYAASVVVVFFLLR